MKKQQSPQTNIIAHHQKVVTLKNTQKEKEKIENNPSNSRESVHR
jgi:hypothetical protein